eukprot:scaffold37111_cov270-Isochrysis_galbana.AAC.2
MPSPSPTDRHSPSAPHVYEYLLPEVEATTALRMSARIDRAGRSRAGAGTGQAFDGAEPGVEHRRSARPSRCSSLHRPCASCVQAWWQFFCSSGVQAQMTCTWRGATC